MLWRWIVKRKYKVNTGKETIEREYNYIPVRYIIAALIIPAYPIYRYISNKIRNELAPQILSLSEEILKK